MDFTFFTRFSWPLGRFARPMTHFFTHHIGLVYVSGGRFPDFRDFRDFHAGVMQSIQNVMKTSKIHKKRYVGLLFLENGTKHHPACIYTSHK